MLTALPGFLTTLLAALPWILRLLAGLLTALLLATLTALIGIVLLLLITHFDLLHWISAPIENAPITALFRRHFGSNASGTAEIRHRRVQARKPQPRSFALDIKHQRSAGTRRNESWTRCRKRGTLV